MAARLYGSFRRDDASDPDIFLQGVAAIFRNYPSEVLMQVVDPFSGLPSKSTFPPSFREIKESCEAIEAPHRRIREWDDRTQRQLLERDQATGGDQRSSIEELADKFGKWREADDHEPNETKRDRARRISAWNQREIEKTYARMQAEPVMVGDLIVSPDLVRSFQRLAAGKTLFGGD